MTNSPRGIAVILVAATCVGVPARADEFSDFSSAFRERTRKAFHIEPQDAWSRKAVFVRRDYLARLAQTVSERIQPVLHVAVDDLELHLDPMSVNLHTGDWDCSVNHWCGSCDGASWFARGPCELGRAACALGLSPIIAACAAGKALDGTRILGASFDPARLSLAGDATDFHLTVAPTFDAAHAQPKLTVAGTVKGLSAAVDVHPVVGIFTGCVVPQSVHVPDIGVSLTNASLPLDASLSLELVPADAPQQLEMALKLAPNRVKVDVNTGDVFGWISKNPVSLFTCALPSVAAITYATRVQQVDVPVPSPPMLVRLGTLSLRRGGEQVRLALKLTDEAIGLVEEEAHQ